MTHCTDLAALIAAETDPERKAALQAQYERECPSGQPGADDSGDNSPPPKHPIVPDE